MVDNKAMDTSVDLINRIKNGDERSFEVLLENNRKIIYKIIYDHNLKIGDYMIDEDNLFQEGCIALYKAVFSFEPEKGMSFSSYAYMIVRGHVNNYYRDNVKKRNEEFYSIDSIENPEYHMSLASTSVSDNPSEYHREREFENKLNRFIETLDIEDRQILEMRSNNHSYKDISDRLDINTKRVDNRLRLLRKRLKEYLEENKDN